MMSEALLDTGKLAELQENTSLPEELRRGILPKFVSRDRCQQLQERDAVTMDIADLCLAFYLPLPQLSDENSSASILLTRPLMKRIGWTLQKTYQLALSHIEQETVIRPFGDVIASLLPDSALPASGVPEHPEIFFVSNRQHINGAAAILCPGTRQKLEEKLGSPFLLLPSSVHEVLCLSIDQDGQYKVWSDMVHEVNETCVDPPERLSDHAYLCMEGALLPV